MHNIYGQTNLSLPIRVAEKISKKAGIERVGDEDEEAFVVLKGAWHLADNVCDTLQKL